MKIVSLERDKELIKTNISVKESSIPDIRSQDIPI